jgi:hypothetical protein
MNPFRGARTHAHNDRQILARINTHNKLQLLKRDLFIVLLAPLDPFSVGFALPVRVWLCALDDAVVLLRREKRPVA